MVVRTFRDGGPIRALNHGVEAGGIGSFEVQPTYPLALDDASKGIENLPFLSQEFLSRLRFTSDKARQLGLRMDLTLGSGWPFGGPQIPVGQASGRLRIDKVAVSGDRVPLPDIGNGEQFIAAFDAASNRELTDVREGFVYPGFSTKEVFLFHCEPNRNDGKAGVRGSGRFCAGSLRLPTTDAWSHLSAGRVHMTEQLRELVGPDLIPEILNAGYGFDFFR